MGDFGLQHEVDNFVGLSESQWLVPNIETLKLSVFNFALTMEIFDLFNSDDPERWRRLWWLLGILILFLAAFGVLLWWILFADYESTSGSSKATNDRVGDTQNNDADNLSTTASGSTTGSDLNSIDERTSETISNSAAADSGSASGSSEGRVSDRDYSSVLANSFSGEPVSTDQNLGILYNTKPEKTDDLTEIKGVGEVIQTRLNDDGVYRFEQIAHWDEHNATAFGKRLEFPGRIEREEWIPQAKQLADSVRLRETAIEEPEPDLPSDVDYVGLEKNYTNETNLRVDHKLGLIFTSSANCEDDLTEIRGIGNVLSKKLNEVGVFRFQQIADWNDYNIWSFNRIIAFPGRIQRDEWVRQAKELAPTSRCLSTGKARVSAEDLDQIIKEEFDGEDVEIREPFGIIYKSEPAETDNLQDIWGVGPVLEKKLHDFGVYRFKQIANWPDAAIDEFQEQLSFPDRIRRDDWVSQCLKLAKGEKPR